MRGLKDGGPAYPMKTVDAMGNEFYGTGMSLRDWFAGQALAGLAAYSGKRGTIEDLAEYSYLAADAMIKARST